MCNEVENSNGTRIRVAVGSEIQIHTPFREVYECGTNSDEEEGNSKSYLELKILKAIFVMINFGILYHYGISPYLYSLLVTCVLNVILSVTYASLEIDLPIGRLGKPILIQGSIIAIAILITTIAGSMSGWSHWLTLLIKSSILVFVYLGISGVFQTQSFTATLKHVVPVFEKWYKRHI